MKNCIILHLYYQDLWPEFKANLKYIVNEDNDLYVSICEKDDRYYDDIAEMATEVFILPNKGFDFGPFIYIYNKIKDLDYLNITKIHGKKSAHNPIYGEVWRKGLCKSLIGDVQQYRTIMDYMESDPYTYMVGPQEYLFKESTESVNYKEVLDEINVWYDMIQIENREEGFFFAGSMFICSKYYLDLLFDGLDLDKVYDMFEEGGPRVSLAHGLERFIGFAVKEFGGKFAVI